MSTTHYVVNSYSRTASNFLFRLLKEAKKSNSDMGDIFMSHTGQITFFASYSNTKQVVVAREPVENLASSILFMQKTTPTAQEIIADRQRVDFMFKNYAEYLRSAYSNLHRGSIVPVKFESIAANSALVVQQICGTTVDTESLDYVTTFLSAKKVAVGFDNGAIRRNLVPVEKEQLFYELKQEVSAYNSPYKNAAVSAYNDIISSDGIL